MKNKLDLLRVTEAGAIAASQWVGSGDKLSADKEATQAMRHRLNNINFQAKVISGEGEKDDSYGIYYNERVGRLAKTGFYCYDLAIDPIEGTTPCAFSGPESMSVIALGEQNSFFHTNEFYMKKMVYGAEIKNYIELNLNDPWIKIIDNICDATKKTRRQILVCILNRPRHEKIINELREIGCRIKLIQDCDVSGSVAACLSNNEIDLMYGIGGSPEGVLSACAIKCLNGHIQAQVCTKQGEPLSDILNTNDLVQGECLFAATGITDGSLLKGVKWHRGKPTTHSVFMRSESKTIRWITAEHGN